MSQNETSFIWPPVIDSLNSADDLHSAMARRNISMFDDYDNESSANIPSYNFESFLLPSLSNRTPITNRTAISDELLHLFRINYNMIQNLTNDSNVNGITQVFNTTNAHLCDPGYVHASWSVSWERTSLFFSGFSVASLVALLNLCVIIMFFKCDDVRRTPQNLYILNLAICDFCVGVNSLPGVTLYFYNMCWPYGITLCQLMTGIDWITSTETGISMCLIAYDRLQLVRLGALYSVHETRGVVARRILLSWISVTGLMCPGFIMPYFTGVSVNALGDCVNEIYQIESLGTAVATVTGIVPPLTLAIIYYCVLQRMRLRRRSMSNSSANQVEREARRQRRLAGGMKLLSTVFFASWIPPTLFDLATFLIKNISELQPLRWQDDNQIAFQVLVFSKFWIYLNSLVNPFLYAFAFRAIRGGMERTFLPSKYRRILEQKRQRIERRGSRVRHEKSPRPRQNSSSNCLSVKFNANSIIGKRLLRAVGNDEALRNYGGINNRSTARALSPAMFLQAPKIELRASLTSSSTVPNNTKTPDSAHPSKSDDSRSSIVINLAAINYNTIVMSTATSHV